MRCARSRHLVSAGPSRVASRQVACGVIAGPLFAAVFTALGSTRSGYDWRRHPVSALARGPGGWMQRANFITTGLLYTTAALGAHHVQLPGRSPRAVPVLFGVVGASLISSGVFVTDPVAGYPPPRSKDASDEHIAPARSVPTVEGTLHNLSAVPIFSGIPLAALASATTAMRRRNYWWAGYSAVSGLGMAGSFVMFGRAFATDQTGAGNGGAFQRVSIAAGFGWLTALALRTRHSFVAPVPSVSLVSSRDGAAQVRITPAIGVRHTP